MDELALLDIDPERLEVVGALAERMLRKVDWSGRLVRTGDRDEALEGADFVIVQLRVGGNKARYLDETIPLRFGCIGQETTGPGGFAKALRTVPVVLELADETARRGSPGVWFVDFTNPTGLVTQALLDEGHRALGLCNVAIGFQRELAARFGVEPERVQLEHVGLNHLSWSVRCSSTAWTDCPRSSTTSRSTRRRRTSPSRSSARSARCPATTCATTTSRSRSSSTSARARRPAEEVMEIEAGLLELYKDPALDEKPKLLEERGGAFYSEAAAQLVASLHAGTGDVQVVNLRNEGAIPNLPDDDVVEISARIDRDGRTRARSRRSRPSCSGSSSTRRRTSASRSRRPSPATV